MTPKKKAQLDQAIAAAFVNGIIVLFLVAAIVTFSPTLLPIGVASTLYCLSSITLGIGSALSDWRYQDELTNPQPTLDYFKAFGTFAAGTTFTGAAFGLFIGSIIAPGVGSLLFMGIGAGVGFVIAAIPPLILCLAKSKRFFSEGGENEEAVGIVESNDTDSPDLSSRQSRRMSLDSDPDQACHRHPVFSTTPTSAAVSIAGPQPSA